MRIKSSLDRIESVGTILAWILLAFSFPTTVKEDYNLYSDICGNWMEDNASELRKKSKWKPTFFNKYYSNGSWFRYRHCCTFIIKQQKKKKKHIKSTSVFSFFPPVLSLLSTALSDKCFCFFCFIFPCLPTVTNTSYKSFKPPVHRSNSKSKRKNIGTFLY